MSPTGKVDDQSLRACYIHKHSVSSMKLRILHIIEFTCFCLYELEVGNSPGQPMLSMNNIPEYSIRYGVFAMK